MYAGVTPTKFGRFHVAEPLKLSRFHRTSPDLQEVDHEPPIPVLDQEDLGAQGIRVSTLVAGAQDVDALGSCTCNAGTASLAQRTAAAGKAQPRFGQVQIDVNDPVACEEFAITLYHLVTDQTGDPSSEWPPSDCGSTGLYVCTELQRLGFIRSFQSAQDPLGAASLLQSGTVIMGLPWFNSWMDPDADGFVDGDGSDDAFEEAMSSGVAGGHETCITALEKLAYDEHGNPDLQGSWFRVRNSWSEKWGDKGSYRIHLSTLAKLVGYADYKAFEV